MNQSMYANLKLELHPANRQLGRIAINRPVTEQQWDAIKDVLDGTADNEPIVSANAHDQLVAALGSLLADDSPVWKWVNETGIGREEYQRRSGIVDVAVDTLKSAGAQ
jgi:hypothetical protein